MKRNGIWIEEKGDTKGGGKNEQIAILEPKELE